MNGRELPTSRRVMIGGLAWIAVVQIFLIDTVVAARWFPDYRLRRDPISALGITHCGRINGVWGCSSWHEASDIAWMISGICLIIGAWCNISFFRPTLWRNAGLSAAAISGAGLVSTALNPLNERVAPHLVSAGFSIAFGGMGAFFLGLVFLRRGDRRWGATGIVCGIVSLIAGLGIRVDALRPLQGMYERVAIWPNIAWIIGTGIIILQAAWKGRSTSLMTDDG
ncbi:DUF998 domain-containing protein [Streptomyces sp. NPDC127084]|uniref:DUF998 domain-containing protein n=1 Tax=Streptomyces sp. NPDC127084 TaxID=3347133 RepID=UPI00365DB5AD